METAFLQRRLSKSLIKQSETTFLTAGFLVDLHNLMSILNLKGWDHGMEHFPNLAHKGIPFQGTSVTILAKTLFNVRT